MSGDKANRSFKILLLFFLLIFSLSAVPGFEDNKVVLDLSKKTPIQRNIKIILSNGFVFNASQRDSWISISRTAEFRCRFSVSPQTGSTQLVITHLSSASQRAQGGGYSPVTILINGKLLVQDFDPAENHGGVHHFVTDKWKITPLLHSGENEIAITVSPKAQTQYWIQRLEIFEDESDFQKTQLIRSLQFPEQTITQVIKNDPIVRGGEKALKGANWIMREDKVYEMNKKAYEDYVYYMAQLRVRIGIVSKTAGMDYEYQCRADKVEKYITSVDNPIMVSNLEQSLAICSVRLSPKDQFSRELYNAYLKKEEDLRKIGDSLRQILLQYMSSRSLRNDIESFPIQMNQARIRGLRDAGGVKGIDAKAMLFTNDVLIPFFESAKSTAPAESPTEAAAKLLQGLSHACLTDN